MTPPSSKHCDTYTSSKELNADGYVMAKYTANQMEDVEDSLLEDIEEYANLDDADLSVNAFQDRTRDSPTVQRRGESPTNRRRSDYNGKDSSRRDGHNDRPQYRDRQGDRGRNTGTMGWDVVMDAVHLVEARDEAR